MSRNLLLLTLTLGLTGLQARADVPKVVTDTAPVHSLVSMVLDGIAEPSLVIPPEVSPHDHRLRPSQAKALQEAGIVFWIGADLTPWLGQALERLSPDAVTLALMEAEGTKLLDIRESANFEAHDHDDHADHADHDGHDDHDDHADHDKHEDHNAHDDHADHEGHNDHADHSDHDDHGKHDDHADHEGHDEHEEHADHKDHDDHADHKDHDEHADHEEHADHDAHEGEGHAGHDHHDGQDPHVWLSLENAQTWLDIIAAEMIELDPTNADAYLSNAAKAKAELGALRSEIDGLLAPVRGRNFVVFHDAYQYFEDDFALPATGAISLSDASQPSPARIAEVQHAITSQNVSCVLAEPQFNPGLVATVTNGVDANTGVLDPMGSNLTPGSALYPALMRDLAEVLAECL